MTCDYHLHVRLVDGHITVGYVEHHILEIGIGVGELTGSESHVRCAHHRSGGCGGAVESKVGCGVSWRAIRYPDVNIITADTMLVCIIIQYTVMTFNRHNYRTSRHNLQPTVGYDVEGYVEVIVGVRKGCGDKSHLVSADLDARCRGGGAAYRSNIVKTVVGNGCEARYTQCITRAGLRGSVTRDVYGYDKRCNGQCASCIIYVVVALNGIAGGRDGIGADILTSSAGERVTDDAQGVFILKTAHRSGKHRVGIVVDFRLVICRHGHRCSGNRQRARFVNHIVVALHIIASGCDGVGTYILAFHTGNHVADDTCGITVLQTSDRRCQRRLVCTVNLALGIC